MLEDITATITSKGQVTIPIDIRNMLNLEEGDKLSFKIEDSKTVKLQNEKSNKLNKKKPTFFGSLTPHIDKDKVLTQGDMESAIVKNMRKNKDIE